MTPFPSSTAEEAQWLPYSRPPPLDLPYGIDPPPPVWQHSNLIDRPRSSPSTFGPSAATIPWPENALGIRLESHQHQQPQAQAPLPQNSPYLSQTYTHTPIPLTTASPPSPLHPQPRRSYPPLAPALTPSKRRLSALEEASSTPSSTSAAKRKRTSSLASNAAAAVAELSDDDRFLVALKEDECLPWKEIAARFAADKGKQVQVAALQMRYKRLREKCRVWDARDVEALGRAVAAWERERWDIVASKVSFLLSSSILQLPEQSPEPLPESEIRDKTRNHPSAPTA